MARTRSASTHKKVFCAALKLVAERGVNATSMAAHDTKLDLALTRRRLSR